MIFAVLEDWYHIVLTHA